MSWKESPEQEARRALEYGGTERSELSQAGQLAYDRLRPEYSERIAIEEAAKAKAVEEAGRKHGRTSPETREQILRMFKQIRPKYAVPFEGNRLAVGAFFNNDWKEYGQVVLQMAILDTLLSVEELLSKQQQGD